MKKHIVFVYGTLRAGCGNHRLLQQPGATRLAADAEVRISGYKMLHLGGFPGIIPGEPTDEIVGELYAVNDEVLRSLDYLEGYRAENDPGNLYDRVEIGKTVQATPAVGDEPFVTERLAVPNPILT
jgi:gamma-glutamylcyclotransferase (GGCT)/AIG2-like uncharacterized protein YtfP